LIITKKKKRKRELQGTINIFFCFFLVNFAELMVLGFISLTLTFSQSYIAGICIPLRYANTMLPCPAKGQKGQLGSGGENHRRLLWSQHRFLAGDSGSKECKDVSMPCFQGNVK
jgi:mlo protein